MKKIKIICQLCMLMLFLSACIGNNIQNDSQSHVSKALTMDTMGVVPVFYDSSTTTVFFLHNNTTQDIHDIEYEVISSNNDFKLLNICHDVKAHQACKIKFATPILTYEMQGSALIKVSYRLNGTEYIAEEQINYHLVDDIQDGIYFASELQIANYNPINYGVVYMYATGLTSNISFSLSVNNQIFNINQETPDTNIISTHEVIAIEISANNPNRFEHTHLNITPTVTNFKPVNTIISINPDRNGAQLVSGLSPVINVLTNPEGHLVITNIGNQTATLESISLPTGVSLHSGVNECSITNGLNKLNPGISCIIYFSVAQQAGNGDIVINYSGGVSNSLSSEIIWYNRINSALLSMSSNPKEIVFTVLESGNALISTTNIGGYDLSGMSITLPITYSGYGVPSNTSTLSCTKNGIDTGNDLPVGGSCSYTVSMTDIAVESDKVFNVGLSGHYTNGSGTHIYNRVMSVQYSALQTAGVYIFKTELGHNGDFDGNIESAAQFCKDDPANPWGAGNSTWLPVFTGESIFDINTTYTVMNRNFVRESYTPNIPEAKAFSEYAYYNMFATTGLDADIGAWTGMTRLGATSSRCLSDGKAWNISTSTGVSWINNNGANAQNVYICGKLMSLICVEQ